jgi:hypothetical protein
MRFRCGFRGFFISWNVADRFAVNASGSGAFIARDERKQYAESNVWTGSVPRIEKVGAKGNE